MDKLIPSFQDSLLDNPFANLSIDWLELGIDSFLDDGLVKDIPFVGQIVKAGKLAQNIHDRNLLKQTAIFIQTFNKGTINQVKLDERRELILKDKNKFSKELSRVLTLLNRTIDDMKSVYLGKLYLAYFNGDISWDVFCELSDVIDRLFISDVPTLLKVYRYGWDANDDKSYNCDRLISLGLMALNLFEVNNDWSKTQYVVLEEFEYGDDKSINNEKAADNESPGIISLTNLGKNFCQYIS